MKIQDIFAEWDRDCKIDPIQLDNESLKISELHNKYYKIYINEKVHLKKIKAELVSLRHEKHEFYTMGPTEDTKTKGWILPPRGKILKNEVDTYLNSDPDIVKLTLTVGIQEEKIELVKSILETISKRSFQIRAAIDFLKFQNGII